jgi:hypothetical protein
MCTSPNRLRSGQLVSCRECWQCNAQKIGYWAGKCIAEAQHSKKTYFVTLTYGRDQMGVSDHINATILTYSDVQKFLKKIRFRLGTKFRYFVSGEYGSLNDRAHWHMLLFCKEAIVPDIKLNERIEQKDWDHGYSQWKVANYKHAFYAAKYCLKSDKFDSEYHYSMQPALGTEWFQRYAQSFVEHGLAPQDPFYKFDNVRSSKGKILNFMMKETNLFQFIEFYADQWRKKYPHRHLPASDMVEQYFDKKALKQRDIEMTFEDHLYRKKLERSFIDVEEAVAEYEYEKERREKYALTYAKAKSKSETLYAT